MRLVVYLPAFNEAATIGALLDTVPPAIAGITDVSVIVVDDGSTDETVGVAEHRGVRVVRHGRNLGTGRAFVSGVQAALDEGADIIVGNEHAPERLRRFLHMYPRVAASGQGAFEYVDLRYSNGFAMKWPGAPVVVPASAPPPPATPDPAPVEDA